MKYELEKKEGGIVARIFGALSERSAGALAALDAELTTKLVVFDLDGLTRVDAAGEALWANFLATLKRRAKYGFRNCSVYFVEAVNKSPDLVRGGKITSFHAPLTCPACRHAATIVLESERVKPQSTFGAPPCGKCGRAMDPAVPPAGYLAFLFGD